MERIDTAQLLDEMRFQEEIITGLEGEVLKLQRLLDTVAPGWDATATRRDVTPFGWDVT